MLERVLLSGWGKRESTITSRIRVRLKLGQYCPCLESGSPYKKYCSHIIYTAVREQQEAAVGKWPVNELWTPLGFALTIDGVLTQTKPFP